MKTMKCISCEAEAKQIGRIVLHNSKTKEEVSNQKGFMCSKCSSIFPAKRILFPNCDLEISIEFDDNSDTTIKQEGIFICKGTSIRKRPTQNSKTVSHNPTTTVGKDINK